MGGLFRLPTPQTPMVQRGGFDAGGGIVGDIVADSSTWIHVGQDMGKPVRDGPCSFG